MNKHKAPQNTEYNWMITKTMRSQNLDYYRIPQKCAVGYKRRKSKHHRLNLKKIPHVT